MAQDVRGRDEKVIKRYIKGTLENLKQLWNIQPLWISPHWYEICLERPTYLFLDIESDQPESVVQMGISAIRKFVRKSLQVDIEVLSSCDETKQSYHIVAPVFFKNVYHVGAWVRTCWRYMKDRLYFHDPDDDETQDYYAGIRIEEVDSLMVPECIIDMSVYTRNRAFRLEGSSKLGSTRVLEHPTKKWWDLIVQPPVPSDANIRIEKELGELEPVSSSMPPWRMFMFENEVWKFKNTPQNNTISRQNRVLCTVPDSLQPLISYLVTHWQLQRSSMTYNVRKNVWHARTRCRRCNIADREHKSNHVKLTIFMDGTVIQSCFDDECHGQAVELQVHDVMDFDEWRKRWQESVVY